VSIILAILGAVVFFCLRNDTDEFKLGRTPWVVAALVTWAAAMWFQNPGLHLVQYAVAFIAFAFLLTYAHGPILQGPDQKCSDTPDYIETAFMELFDKIPGDRMGYPMWIAYAGMRYVLPSVIIALAIENPAYAIAGLGATVGYWPIAHTLASGEKTKHVGAAICGAFIYGLI
jgi:hypothetical protein